MWRRNVCVVSLPSLILHIWAPLHTPRVLLCGHSTINKSSAEPAWDSSRGRLRNHWSQKLWIINLCQTNVLVAPHHSRHCQRASCVPTLFALPFTTGVPAFTSAGCHFVICIWKGFQNDMYITLIYKCGTPRPSWGLIFESSLYPTPKTTLPTKRWHPNNTDWLICLRKCWRTPRRHHAFTGKLCRCCGHHAPHRNSPPQPRNLWSDYFNE